MTILQRAKEGIYTQAEIKNVKRKTRKILHKRRGKI